MREELKFLYELIVDGDHYQYAINRLRGLLFRALCKECDHLFAKNRVEVPTDDDEVLLPSMERLIDNLGKISEILCDSLCDEPINLYKHLSPLIKEEGVVDC